MAEGANFEALIAQLLVAEDDVRAPAEALFETLKQQPDALIGNFLAVMRTSALVEHRQFATIMMRKVRYGGYACRQRMRDRCMAAWRLRLTLPAAQVLTKEDPPLWPKCSTVVQVGG